MLGLATYSELPFSTVVNVAEVLEGSASILAEGTFTVGEVIIGRLAKPSFLGVANVDVMAGVNRTPLAIDILSEATLRVSPSIVQTFIFYFEGTGKLEVSGEIAGEGWERINPDTPEWQYKESSKWNKIN
jgi:hypothetical protein